MPTWHCDWVDEDEGPCKESVEFLAGQPDGWVERLLLDGSPQRLCPRHRAKAEELCPRHKAKAEELARQIQGGLSQETARAAEREAAAEAIRRRATP